MTCNGSGKIKVGRPYLRDKKWVSDMKDCPGCDQCPPKVDEEAQQRWDAGLEAVKNEMASAILPGSMEEKRLRDIKTAEASKRIILGHSLGGKESEMSTCEWTHDDYHDKWDTVCGNAHCFIDGTPYQNNYRWCPYCGRKLIQEVPHD